MPGKSTVKIPRTAASKGKGAKAPIALVGKGGGKEPKARPAEKPGRELVCTASEAAERRRNVYDLLNKTSHVAMARMTLGISPAALAMAYFDWAAHLATAPGKQMELAEKAHTKFWRLAGYVSRCMKEDCPECCIEPLPQDHRFRNEAWQKWPFNVMYQSFLLQQQWWHNAMTGVPGMSRKNERIMAFLARQILDVVAPSNSPFTNPEVLRATMAQGGLNLLRGASNFLEDVRAYYTKAPPRGLEAFQVGRDLATTSGKVVYRNRLIELIQYEPTTEKVHPEPILIVPAWIMKYYILDLSPHNSFVRYLVGQGFTVFMISWLNPGKEDRDLSMEDYRRLGVMDALDAVQTITGAKRVHALGYCLGGTLLAIAAAAMGRDGDARLATVSFLAAQTDFTEAGELTLFITESQVSFLEDMMWDQGYLSTEQMGGAFRLLRSVDLIWSRNVHDYLMGERMPMFDLLAWNADGTRLPYTMHSQYLRKLFLNNDLAEGRYEVEGKPVVVSDIRAPILAVGTEEDHVAPWKSVYQFHRLADTDVTFILTNRGHNAGIVSEPGHPGRHFRMATTPHGAPFKDPDDWFEENAPQDGSWWEAFSAWLKARSGPLGEPPPMGRKRGPYAPICDAPGTYVMQR